MKFQRCIMLGLLLMSASHVAVQAREVNVSAQSVQWFDGKRYHQAWVSADELIEFSPQGDGLARQASLQNMGVDAASAVRVPGARIWRVVPDQLTAATRSTVQSEGLSAVFYRSAQGGPRMALSGELIVKLAAAWDDDEFKRWLLDQGAEFVRVINRDQQLFLIKVAPGRAALLAAQALSADPAVEYVMPNWWREVTRR